MCESVCLRGSPPVCVCVCVFPETADWGAHLPIPPKRYFISESFAIQAEEQSLGYACLHSRSMGGKEEGKVGPGRLWLCTGGAKKKKRRRRSPFIIS